MWAAKRSSRERASEVEEAWMREAVEVPLAVPLVAEGAIVGVIFVCVVPLFTVLSIPVSTVCCEERQEVCRAV